ncbi:MAG: hypothetical protein JEY91_08430 [Spirochaetaceae bacterium]|nr:hypothetical protein [Spirochaetaceae bacterium]
MKQKQIFTEYWKVLNDFEDFMNDRFRREGRDIPHFKMNLKTIVPLDPAQCTACFLHEHNSLRSPVLGEGQKKLLIINRALPKILTEKGIHFTPEEGSSISKWLEAIGLDLQLDCKIIPLVFCPVKDPIHPDREAVDSCSSYIDRSLEETNPKAVLILGMEAEELISSNLKNFPLFISPHPSDVLIDPSLKRPVWEILKKLKGVVVDG